MKKAVFIILMILFVLLMIKCGESPPDYGGKITDIKFSSEWNPVTGQLGTPATFFDYGIRKVYYEITFEYYTGIEYMVKKVWQLPNVQSLEAASFIPKDRKRICGEIHYYDELVNMDQGTYQISLKYYEEGEYKDYEYESGVNQTFTIQ